MFRLTRCRLAASLGLYLVLASTGPSVALACEGAAEEKNVSFTPKTWSATLGACPEEGGKVKFEAADLTKWCEYSLKNENKVGGEKIKLKVGEVDLKSPECETKVCIKLIAGKEAGTKECVTPMTLEPGEECRKRIEYAVKPAAKRTLGFDWSLENLPAAGKFFVEKEQTVE